MSKVFLQSRENSHSKVATGKAVDPSFYDKDFINPSKNDLSHNKNFYPQLIMTEFWPKNYG